MKTADFRPCFIVQWEPFIVSRTHFSQLLSQPPPCAMVYAEDKHKKHIHICILVVAFKCVYITKCGRRKIQFLVLFTNCLLIKRALKVKQKFEVFGIWFYVHIYFTDSILEYEEKNYPKQILVYVLLNFGKAKCIKHLKSCTQVGLEVYSENQIL